MINALNKKRLGEDKGFTLVELLVVIVILGILIAIAVPIFLNQRAAAQDRATQSDIRNAVPVMETYYANNGEYPASLAVIQDDISTSDGVTLVIATTNGTDAWYTITGTHDGTDSSFYFDSQTGQIEDGEPAEG